MDNHDDHEVEPGSRLPLIPVGRFTQGTVLAEGRRARVVLAEDRERASTVVLKLPKEPGAADAVLHEARALGRLRHPSVVELVDYGTSEAFGPFLALAPLQGKTLASLVEAHGALPEGWARRALGGLGEALKVVHDAGGVHCDIAPGNVVAVGFDSFETPPRVCLLDFGSSWWPGDPTGGAAQATTAYLAPERIRGETPTALSDVYAWGALAYELLAGVPPFRASTSAELGWLHENEAPRPLGEVRPAARFDARLERLVLGALSKDPQGRPATMEEVTTRLAEIDGTPAKTPEGTTPHRGADDVRAALLERVREYWIENVLERTTDGVILVRQGLVDASVPAAEERLHVAFPRLVDEATGTVVLLGEPGFGKTVNLLRLARHLADRAVAVDGRVTKVPVVFTLSSYSTAAGTFRDWMVIELCAKYQLLRRDAEALLDADAIVPLLDGLDDVPPAAQPTCIDALEAWARSHPTTRLVVTCRTADYRRLDRAVEASLTVELRALSDEDIGRQLRGPAHHPLREALRDDPILSELSRTPVLLHVMRVGLRDSTSFRGALADRSATIGAVFSAFVEASIATGGKLAGREGSTRVVLRRVASLLSKTGRTVFHLEDADPDWLPTRGLRITYAFASRGIAASLLGAAPMLSIGLSPLDNQGMPMSWGFTIALAMTTALVLTAGFGAAALWRQGRPVPLGRSRFGTALRGIGGGLALGSVIGMGVHAFYPYPMAFFMGLESGMIGAGVLSLARHRSIVRGRDIVPVESLGWSWRNVDPKSGAALALFTVGFFALFSHFEESRSGGYAAFALLVLGAAVLGRRSRDLRMKAIPNVGMLRTARSAMVAGTLAFCISTVLFGLSYGIGYGAAVALALATMTALCFGGIDVINHYTVRWLLHRDGAVPLGVSDQLDDGVSVGLVRRVGSGYMFMHSMLQRHLAGTDPERQA